MKVYNSLEEFTKLNNAVVTTGTFDGVHIGHQTILKKLVDSAKQIGGESVLLTFFPHPRMVLQKDIDIKLINTIDEKIELLRKTNIDHLLILPFSKEFSRKTSLEFVQNILVNKIGTSKLIIGYDHQFGRNREGSFSHLKEYGPLYGFDVEEISAQDIDDISVSSTKIRKALIDEGDVKKASNFLGRKYTISGKVGEGKRIGNKIGFPTANIIINESYKLIPQNGVYAVYVEVENMRYKGMLNIGVRPTVNGIGKTIEVNIFDFDSNIYHKNIKIAFVDRIRDEKKFNGLDELKLQLAEDKITAQKILNDKQ
ncbi:MAG: bifunctional riboflavin kinase/FAD synthetase [Ichthyobacteriaceae bacterium]|nr:bifunctional riboflavin kinase/FAD synthetase [Ichthyobacteriaceae bacterium]